MTSVQIQPEEDDDESPRGIGEKASSKPCCIQGHEMHIEDILSGADKNGYKCDVCFGSSANGHCGGGPERWACIQQDKETDVVCAANICFNCFPKDAVVQVCCKKKHPLIDYGLQKDNGRWGCDGMREPKGCASGMTGFRQSKGKHSLRCDKCDYDLCRPCHDRMMMKTAGLKARRMSRVSSKYKEKDMISFEAIAEEITQLRRKLAVADRKRLESSKILARISDKMYEQGLQINKSQTLAPFEAIWDKPTNEYNLPESIYSGAMIFPLSGPWNEENMTNGERIALFGLPMFNYFLILVATFSAQFIFMWFVQKETLPGKAKVDCAAAHLLVMLGLITFFIQVLSDVSQTYEMIMWIVLSKTSKKMEQLEYLVGEDGEVSFKSGMTLGYKYLWCMPIVCVKLTLSGFVGFYGCFFIAMSETNMDVILNCVALCFVFELDDYAYQFFTQSWTRQVIESMPSITRPKGQGLLFCEMCCGPCCIVIFIILISYATYGTMCVGNNPEWLPLTQQGNNTNSTGIKIF